MYDPEDDLMPALPDVVMAGGWVGTCPDCSCPLQGRDRDVELLHLAVVHPGLLCKSVYPSDDPLTRSVKCHLRKYHASRLHDEVLDGVTGVNTWPVREM